MTDNSTLNERSRAILKEVISLYIADGEPVGSRSISKKHTEKLSPATIRNVMSDLEEIGYLRQPHTSSGRVPTDKGYRFFVDHLLQPPFAAEETDFAENYDFKQLTLEEILATACETLSKTSHQTGLVMFPGFSQMLFRHIEFVKVSPNEALAAFISEMGVLQNKIIPIDKEMTQERLSSISKYLNDEFSGKSIKTIRRELLRRIRSEKERYNQLMKKAIELWSQTFAEENEAADLLVEGSLNFLDYPDFVADMDKMKIIIKTVEEKTKLIKLLDLCLRHDGMTIIIGEENHEKEIQECSLVAQNYRLGTEKLGAIAVLGPKRMDYQKIIAIVNNTAKTVSKLLSQRNKREFNQAHA